MKGVSGMGFANAIYMLAGLAAGLGAFWFVSNYILKRLDSKLGKDVFTVYCQKIDERDIARRKQLDRFESVLENHTAAFTALTVRIEKLISNEEGKEKGKASCKGV